MNQSMHSCSFLFRAATGNVYRRNIYKYITRPAAPGCGLQQSRCKELLQALRHEIFVLVCEAPLLSHGFTEVKSPQALAPAAEDTPGAGLVFVLQVNVIAQERWRGVGGALFSFTQRLAENLEESEAEHRRLSNLRFGFQCVPKGPPGRHLSKRL